MGGPPPRPASRLLVDTPVNEADWFVLEGGDEFAHRRSLSAEPSLMGDTATVAEASLCLLYSIHHA